MQNNYLTKSITSFLFFIFICSINAQNNFEKGYFIDNNQNKVECFIKNLDWKNNPEDFIYKITETGNTEVGNLNTVSMFEIPDVVIYKRAKVQTETNATISKKLDYSEKLDLTDNTVFLKLLVGGNINLYMYSKANSRLFYYQTQNGDITLLEYKEYINSDEKIAKNRNYKKQLWSVIKCNSIDVNTLNNIDYTQQDLISLVADVNTCENELSYVFKNKKQNSIFKFNIRPGVNFAKTNFDSPGANMGRLNDFDFDREITFRIGFEIEYTLPFNNNKWALILEPTYQYYKTEKVFDTNPRVELERIETATVDYSSIELPIGFRHYSYLNADSRLFFNFSAILDLSLKSKITYGNEEYEGDSGTNVAFGVGYSHKDKYSVEARLSSSRDILNSDVNINSDYNYFSLIFGYTIF